MITVLYSCKQCGLKDRAVQVPAREHQDVDVVRWMREVVGSVLSDDHRRASPHCRPDSLSDIKIPLADAEFIGQQVE